MSSLAMKNSGLFFHTIRRAGNVTSLVASLDIGQKVMVRGPFGRGWPVEEVEGRDVLVVGGGIGLAPLRPFLLHCLANRKKIGKLVLVYGAKSQPNMIYRQDLVQWQDMEVIKTVYCVDEAGQGKGDSLIIREGLVPEFLEGLGLDQNNSVAFVCGPEVMMRFVARKLLQEGYPGNCIYLGMERRMRCGTAHCGHCQIGARFVCRDGPVFTYADIARFADTIV